MHEKLSPDRGLDHGFDHGLDHGLGAGRALNGTSAREVAMKSTFVPVLSFEGRITRSSDAPTRQRVLWSRSFRGPSLETALCASSG